jgi:hypothetical protein
VQYLRAELVGRTTLRLLPDGTLLDFFARQDPIDAVQNVVRYEVIRSVDQGASWSGPVPIGVAPLNAQSDPATGDAIRSSAYFYSCTVDAKGTAYVAYYDYTGSRTKLLLARSTDGGHSWRQSVVANVPAAAFLPVVVARPGVVSVVWDDLRDFHPGGPLWTRTWIATSRNAGRSWVQRAVTGTFDLRRAPKSYSGMLGSNALNPEQGYFLGDYRAAVPLADRVLLVTSLTPPISGRDPSHVFLVRIPW